METLPAEMLIGILKYLDLNDQIKCRLVCAKWRFLIDNNVKIKSLLIQKFKPKFNEVYLFSFDCELKLINHLLSIKSIRFFEIQFIQTILRNLKQLHINLIGFNFIELPLIDQLNQFEQLEHLKIENMDLYQKTIDSSKTTLRLANLKYLSVSNLSIWLVLDTPKLYALELTKQGCHAGSLKFMYPQSISHLKMFICEEEIKQFINLEFYYVHNVCYSSKDFGDDDYRSGLDEYYEIPNDILTLLPKLKEIHVGYPMGQYYVYAVDAVKAILSNQNKQRRSDFNFYYCGLAISSINDLMTNFVDESGGRLKKMNNSSGFQFLLDNFSRLPTLLCWNKVIDYSLLLKFFAPNQIDEKFLNRFTNLMKIKVDSTFGNLELFSKLVRKSQYLVSLRIINVSLGQSFYDSLSLDIQHIKKLSIINEDTKLNFEFILKLNNLEKFKTDQTVPFALISEALSKLDYTLVNLKRYHFKSYYFHFKFLNKPVKISLFYHEKKLKWSRFSSDKEIKFDHVDSLFEFIKNLAVFD